MEWAREKVQEVRLQSTSTVVRLNILFFFFVFFLPTPLLLWVLDCGVV